MISQQMEVRRNPQHWNVSLVNPLDVFTYACIHVPQCVTVPVPAWLNVPGSSEVTCITIYVVFLFSSKIHRLIAYIFHWHDEEMQMCLWFCECWRKMNPRFGLIWLCVSSDYLCSICPALAANSHTPEDKKNLLLMNFTLWWLWASLSLLFLYLYRKHSEYLTSTGTLCILVYFSRNWMFVLMWLCVVHCVLHLCFFSMPTFASELLFSAEFASLSAAGSGSDWDGKKRAMHTRMSLSAISLCPP